MARIAKINQKRDFAILDRLDMFFSVRFESEAYRFCAALSFRPGWSKGYSKGLPSRCRQGLLQRPCGRIVDGLSHENVRR